MLIFILVRVYQRLKSPFILTAPIYFLAVAPQKNPIHLSVNTAVMSSMIRVGSMMLLCLICCLSVSAETRHIHLLKIMDTQNADYVIREGCRSIDYGIAQEIEMLREKLGINQLLQYDISGADFRLDKLDEVLSYDMEYL